MADSQVAVVNASDISQVTKFANELKQFIVDNGFYTEIQGKNYAHVEAWQYAAMRCGFRPIVSQVTEMPSDAGEIKYQSLVQLHDMDGRIVGGGVAVCSSRERSNRKDEYAIAAMAQTRAISRAVRNSLSWVLKIAGYEATPADEMSDNNHDTTQDKQAVRDRVNASINA